MTPPTKLTRLARAKVNLCLHITGKNAAGLHFLDSLVVFPEFGDLLSVTDSNSLKLKIDGPFAAGLRTQDNLVLKAARLMADGRGAAINLRKNLPLASGIGGGSSDAAAVLHLLSKLWQVALPTHEKILELGADIPVCLTQSSQRMQGIGQLLEPLTNLPEFALVLANTGTPVSTAQIFQGLTNVKMPKIEEFDGFATPAEFFDFLNRQRNDMQDTAIKLEPNISNVINALAAQPYCKLARMSGSGGTCFGLFETLEKAQKAAHNIREKHSNWWIIAAKV